MGEANPEVGKATDGKGEMDLVGCVLGSGDGPASDADVGCPGRAPSQRKTLWNRERPGQQPARKHWFPICRNSRRNGEQRGTRGERGREGRLREDGSGGTEVSGRVMVREPDPGTALSAGFQRNWRKGWQGRGRKRNRRRETTPELPDQVIAVRCQSAAEGEVGEREEGHAPGQSGMGQRENISQE